ncbi:sigma-54-dependent Fis family transcriptional regulator [Rhodoferax sp.]|uniref:sigma-54-dependent Fis family transcriptional regulator n=1 Tax=Rhodoferax sp. TaxID=50421 RepID=UPI0026032288|nr:sigma-54-dependent Fis family transcriptional regulator [Rhodoferax sp.]MDD2925078.1 sigma-54-dependent Fis family transcriptional regulator [Rhodoferax sp.]
MPTPSPVLALRRARLHLLEHGDFPSEGVDARVARSWQRSLAAGLLPAGRLLDTEHASASELSRTMASNHDLLAHSRPVMEVLFEQVRHLHGMVILADRRGTLMHTLGQVDFLSRAERVALSCGASWHEQHRGTNAIGTALMEATGIEIHGAEHFFERHEFLTCTAVPIRSAMGELMGVLDISGDQRSRQPHTMGLVSMATRLIENRLIAATCRRHLLLHLHPQVEGIGTVAEGIVAVSEDGWIVGGNHAGFDLLHVTAAEIGAVQIKNLLDVSLDELLSRHRCRPGQANPVRLPDGTLLFVRLQRDAGTLLAGTTATPARVNSLAAPTREAVDALGALDTGDTRWRIACEKTRRVLDKPIPLLIQGESGVGKELFARAAHDSGPRRHQPFVAINCASVPESLIEAELFGYAAGAFTGARREGSPGRLREAHGGTLFLDEIGDMPLGLQARLLRVLQERQVTPLGGGQTVAVDFALVCASHRKLRDEVAAGRFRNDLYYRINGLTVVLPPLRERTDFTVLTGRLLADLNPDRQVQVRPELLERLRQHGWPGNLRQYANALRTASAMLDAHEVWIDWRHLPDDLLEDLTPAAVNLVASPTSHGPTKALAEPLQNLQQLSLQAMQRALDDCGGNVSQAARRLGVSRQTLYRKLNA